MPVLTPSYWNFHGHPVRVIKTEDGIDLVQRFDPATQDWELHYGYLAAILGGDPDADEITEEDFERWIAALRAGRSLEDAWEEVLEHSASLVEGVVEAIRGQELSVRQQWWKAQGGLAPTICTGDWVQLRLGAEGAVITEVRPAKR